MVLTLSSDLDTDTIFGPIDADKNGSILHATMKNLLTTGKYSDTKITCQGETFNVHRSILCTQSTFFEAAMNGNFKESTTQTVNLPKEDPNILKLVLSFLYYNEYNIGHHVIESWKCLTSSRDKVEDFCGKRQKLRDAMSDALSQAPYTHVEVYLAADKYGIAALKEYAGECFLSWCKQKQNLARLGKVIEGAMKMKPVHDSQLEQVIARVIAANLAKLVQNGSEGSVLEFLKADGSLAVAVIARLVQDKKLWDRSKEQDVAYFMNRVLWKEKCDHCTDDDGLRIILMEGDFDREMFRCAECSYDYDINDFDYD
ncbi:BTB/POZ domain-containing protein [Aspergillus stella-maris]|uniref:BTB/POZ domain-containing protein n=1 Tax=Aspergillus stella-maris TaxID=1810926 RepID=UPI003CCC96F8